MKKKVYFDGKLIVEIGKKDLPTGYGNRIQKDSKIYIFEDGSYIKASNTKGKYFTYICEECGGEFISKRPPEIGKETYICSKCRGINHNGMSGKHHSEEYKKMKSDMMKGRYDGENNPMFGKSWKDLTTQDIIEKHNKKLSESLSGDKNPMYGKNIKDFMSPEKYEQWKQNVKNAGYHFKSEEEQQSISKKISDAQKRLMENNPEYYKEIKSRGGKATMSKPQNYEKSSIEILVENWLKENNIDYDYSPIMGSENVGIYQYDFIIHNKRILIEVQGDYWHGNPNLFNKDGVNGKRKLNDIQIEKQKKDILKKEFAKKHNFELICIWEEEINNCDFSKLEKIL